MESDLKIIEQKRDQILLEIENVLSEEEDIESSRSSTVTLSSTTPFSMQKDENETTTMKSNEKGKIYVLDIEIKHLEFILKSIKC